MNRNDAVALTMSMGLMSEDAAAAEGRAKNGAMVHGMAQDHWSARAALDLKCGLCKEGVLRLTLEDVREAQYALAQ